MSEKCESCGFDLDSLEHQRGIGLHGHTSTSKEEADEQRAEVFARAQAFSDAVMAESGFAPAPELSREEKIKAAIALLTEEGIITPVSVEVDDEEASDEASPAPAKRGRPRKEVKKEDDDE